MATGFNYDGKVVSVNDQVTIMGSASVISGAGGTAIVTVLPLLTTSTFSAKANDMNAVQDTTGVATSISGKQFDVGDRVSVLGTVTAVSGSGANASLTVTLATSRGSITVPAGSVRSVQFNG